jgi:hypothetical protein
MNSRSSLRPQPGAHSVFGQDRVADIVDLAIVHATERAEVRFTKTAMGGSKVVAMPAFDAKNRRLPGWQPAVLKRHTTGHGGLVTYLKRTTDGLWVEDPMEQGKYAWSSQFKTAVFPLGDHVQVGRGVFAFKTPAEEQLLAHLRLPTTPAAAAAPAPGPATTSDAHTDLYSGVQRRSRGVTYHKDLQNDVLKAAVEAALGPARPRMALVLDSVDFRSTMAVDARTTIVPNFNPGDSRLMHRQVRRLTAGGARSILVQDCSFGDGIRGLAGDPQHWSTVDVVVADYCARWDKFGHADLAALFNSPLLGTRAVVSLTVSHRGWSLAYCQEVVSSAVHLMAADGGFRLQCLHTYNYFPAMMFFCWRVDRKGGGAKQAAEALLALAAGGARA